MSSVMPTEYTRPMSMPGMKNRPKVSPLPLIYARNEVT